MESIVEQNLSDRVVNLPYRQDGEYRVGVLSAVLYLTTKLDSILRTGRSIQSWNPFCLIPSRSRTQLNTKRTYGCSKPHVFVWPQGELLSQGWKVGGESSCQVTQVGVSRVFNTTEGAWTSGEFHSCNTWENFKSGVLTKKIEFALGSSVYVQTDRYVWKERFPTSVQYRGNFV